MKFFLISLICLLSSFVYAQGPLPHEPSLEQLKIISEHNKAQAAQEDFSQFQNLRDSKVKPFAEYQETGYVFFNDDDYNGYAKEIKETIAANLPPGVTLVVYTTSSNKTAEQQIKNHYKKIIPQEQLMVLRLPKSGSNDFWTRDNLPVPVWTEGQVTLVDARYYYNFEPDEYLANLFSTLKTKHNYFFEGGNFIANSKGDCIVVNRKRYYPGGTSDTAAIPDEIFKMHYGCKRVTRFKHLKGIGHSDEVVKFMTDDIIVTDTEEYVETLEELGYQVVMLPEADLKYETYVNSLQVNNVLFVPSFGESNDNKAVEVFESLKLGLKVVTIPTRKLATGGQGGIHCITMNFPPIEMVRLIHDIGAEIIQ